MSDVGAAMSDDNAALRASFERGLSDLERVLAARAEGVDATADKIPPREIMSSTATTAPASGSNGAARRVTAAAAGTDMGGSQVQTAIDRGDYGTHAEALAAQVTETKGKPAPEAGQLGSQVDTIKHEIDDKKYVLARRRAAIRTLLEFAPAEVAASLQKLADGDMGMGEPLGGEPPSVAAGAATADGGAGMNEDPMAAGGAMPDTAAPGLDQSNVLENLQQVLRQKQEDKMAKERDLAVANEIVEVLQGVAGTAMTGAGPDAGGAGGKSAARGAAPVRASARTAAGKNVENDMAGSQVQTAHDAGDYGAASTPDDALASQARAASDKGADSVGNVADGGQTSQRDAGDYPLSRNAAKGATVNNTARRVTAMDDAGDDAALASYKMPSGYAYELDESEGMIEGEGMSMTVIGRDGSSGSSEAWDTVAYTPKGGERAVGWVVIDDANCVVFECPDGKYRAVMEHMAHSREASRRQEANVKPNAARTPAATAAGKTAGKDELQPQAPTGMSGTYDSAESGKRSNEEIAKGTTPTLRSAETGKVVDQANSELAARSRETTKGSVTGGVAPAQGASATTAAAQPYWTDDEVEKLKQACRLIDETHDGLRDKSAAATQLLARGPHVAKAVQTRLAALKRCGDAIQAAVNVEDGSVERGALRATTAAVVRAGKREVADAQLDLMLIEAAVVEAKVARDREARIAPAFKLAIAQAKSQLLAIDELPAKVAEYAQMDPATFDAVAKTVHETVVRASRATRGNGAAKTASRLPAVLEDTMASLRQRDELAGIFD